MRDYRFCCIRCEHAAYERGELPPFFRSFPMCPECGNKRCPKATFHDHACTRSNEPGQPGSVYQ